MSSKTKEKTAGNLYDYTGNILLDKSSNGQFQNLYASQSYGTFFGVYAKFDIVQIKGRQCILNGITLELANFKGLLNIGFLQNQRSYEIHTKKHPNKNTKDIIIDMYVKGNVGEIPKNKLYIGNCNELNDFNNGDRLIVRRRLFSLKEQPYANISGSGQIDARRSRQLNNPGGDSNPHINDAYHGGIFDEEFYFRNGKSLDIKTETDHYFTEKEVKNEEIEVFNDSRSCRRSISQIIVR